MTSYDQRRLLNWVCHHKRSGKSKTAIKQLAAERAPPFPPEWIDAIWPHVERACQNTARLNDADPFTRLCDTCDIPE